VADTWQSFYPPEDVAPEMRSTIAALEHTMPAFVRLLTTHRPPALRGASLAEVMPLEERTPARLLRLYDRWRTDPEEMRRAAPSLAFAVLGQARASARITPEQETELLGRLIIHWAVRSALDTAALSATATAQAMPLGQPAIWLDHSQPRHAAGTSRRPRPARRRRALRRPTYRGSTQLSGTPIPAPSPARPAASPSPGSPTLGGLRTPVSARR
jgi:hypothetical protein